MLKEKDVLQDMLVLDKDIMKIYTDFITESSCPKERALLEKNLNATAKEQFCLFSTMEEKGYYPIKNATPEDVTEAKTQMSQIAKSIGCCCCAE